MKEKLDQFADSSLVAGWLELQSALTGYSVDHRVAGSQFVYKCSHGFELPNKSNPDQVLSCEGSLEVDTSSVTSCVPMTCDEDPDLGLTAGIHNYTWTDNSRLYRTNITMLCPFGQAFNNEYSRELNNTCDFQTDTDTRVSWKYNADRPLPSCIRELNCNCRDERQRDFIVQLTALRVCPACR